MKQAFLRLLTKTKSAIEAEITHNVPTDLLAGEFAFIELPKNTQILATPIDIITQPNHFTPNLITEMIKKTTLGQAVDKMMPELYAIVTGSKNLHGKV
jgi:hypothetical protein